MPRLSNDQRDEVIDLANKGLPQGEIARKMNTTRNTIFHLLKRVKTTGTTEDRPRSGRPKVMPVSRTAWFVCEEEERPFVCTECGKTFKTFSNLKSHMKIHEEILKHQCDQCGRSFSSASALRRHFRTHTGEKPYICEYCARGFADANTVKVHVRTHTGERPHKCHLCGHSCTSAGNLHAHMKVHRDKETGQIPWPINVQLPKSKSVPIFSRKDLLEKAKLNCSLDSCDKDRATENNSDPTSEIHSSLKDTPNVNSFSKKTVKKKSCPSKTLKIKFCTKRTSKYDSDPKITSNLDTYTKKKSKIDSYPKKKYDFHGRIRKKKLKREKDVITYAYGTSKTSDDLECSNKEELQTEQDMFTYRTDMIGNNPEHRLDEDADSSQNSYQVLIKEETDDDISKTVQMMVDPDLSNDQCETVIAEEDPQIQKKPISSKGAILRMEKDPQIQKPVSSKEAVLRTEEEPQIQKLVSSKGAVLRTEEEPCIGNRKQCLLEEDIKKEPCFEEMN